MNRDPKTNVLTIEKLEKRFGSFVALQGVSFRLSTQEVVALVGGNGSGKSTLLRIVAGSLPQDGGGLDWNGQCLVPGNVMQRRALGIELVQQDCGLCPDVSVLENLFMGREQVTRLGFLRRKAMSVRAAGLIDRYGLPIPSLSIEAGRLSGGQKKAIAIGRALLSDPQLLLLDEPTAALGVREQDLVLSLIHELNRKQVGVFLCTHFPQEVTQVAQRILSLHRGQLGADLPVSALSREDLPALMSM